MYSARRRPQAATLVFRRSVSRSFPFGKSWRTLRMARRKRNVSDLPYTVSLLSCATFFVKEQREYKAFPCDGKGSTSLW